MKYYQEPAKQLPVRECDVVVAGGGTAGIVAAIAAARQGAKTILIEAKGYTGGIIVEGGTALHSFYNLWKAFPGVEKKQIVKGIPQEIIDRLAEVGGTSGHAEMERGYDYDSVCTAIDVELYKVVSMEMLVEAGMTVLLNTFVAGAAVEGRDISVVITESRSGREAISAKCYIDSTGYGDLAAHAGASFTELNDYAVANSIGVGGVSLESYAKWMEQHDSLGQFAKGIRSGKEHQIVRISGAGERFPEEFRVAAREIGMASVTTSVHDDYFMFIKLNYEMPGSTTDRDDVTAAELELRRRQVKAVQLLRTWIPGCEHAFIARSSPSLSIRRGRTITCDYDISREDVLEARRFDDEVMLYGFHDCAPRLQIKDGGWYGIPYRALLPVRLDNLLVAGMMITSDWDAHMSTRNTVSCMGQGQAVGTAAALCADKGCSTRDLPYSDLRKTLEQDGVYFES
jgi:hypothetical protein